MRSSIRFGSVIDQRAPLRYSALWLLEHQASITAADGADYMRTFPRRDEFTAWIAGTSKILATVG